MFQRWPPGQLDLLIWAPRGSRTWPMWHFPHPPPFPPQRERWGVPVGPVCPETAGCFPPQPPLVWTTSRRLPADHLPGPLIEVTCGNRWPASHWGSSGQQKARQRNPLMLKSLCGGVLGAAVGVISVRWLQEELDTLLNAATQALGEALMVSVHMALQHRGSGGQHVYCTQSVPPYDGTGLFWNRPKHFSRG